jgi:hypothetical protein
MVRPKRIRSLCLTIGWALILMIGPRAGYGAEINFSGTYSYVDLSAIWFFSVDDTRGEIAGFAWDVARQDIFDIVGTRIDNRFRFEVVSLYGFEGQKNATDVLYPISGLWWDLAFPTEEKDLTRRWQGTRISKILLLDFLGEFAGTYTGAEESGTWDVLIAEDGSCTGTLTPKDSDPADTLTIVGGINSFGEFAWEATKEENGALISRMVMRGYVLGNSGYLTGQSSEPGWRNTLTGDEGTFSGKRDDAMPADFLNSNAESKTCFIDTLLD